MNRNKILPFFKQIASAQIPKKQRGTYFGSGEPSYEYDRAAATQWVTKARTALSALLPPNHPVVTQFESLAKGSVTAGHTFVEMLSTFQAATEMLEAGLLTSVIAGIRAETEGEILDQAEGLLNAGQIVASAVLAGGALETHLHGLCVTNKLTWSGDGSINKYDAAISQARNAGNEIYDATDTKYIGAWGGLRNDAAHKPTTFAASSDTVQRMIEGVREFIRRTT